LHHIKHTIQQQKETEEDFVISRGICPPWSKVISEELQSGCVEINCTNTAIEMAHKYTEENKKEEVQLPNEFKQHAALFFDKEVKQFPPPCE
jgi:hypothetical protein